MTQMMVTAYRINAKDVPMETVYKMVVEEVREQIRAEALKETEGDRARLLWMTQDRAERMRREIDRLADELWGRSLLRRTLDPLATAWAWTYSVTRELIASTWAWAYAIAHELPPALIQRTLDACVRAGLLHRLAEWEE